MPYLTLQNSDDLARTMRKTKTLLYFTASWCGPCQELKPILKELGGDGETTVVEIDVDKHGDLADTHNVSGIPLLKFMTEGGTRVAWQNVGVVSKESILHHIS